ncbi:MAG: glycosyltransferase family 39 protein [Herbiconiux sp.]|nr:glycosyltransferase family 39 protein [Herbiconiux sp.]
MIPSRRLTVPEAVVAGIVLVWGLYQAFWHLLSANIAADELIYVDAGWEYLHGTTTMNLEHPPFAKYLVGAAQLVLGQGLPAGRIAAACAVLLTGVALHLWLRREIGWIGAVAAAGFWLLLPHGSTSGVRLDRYALLEPFMVLFAVLAFAAAWQWYRRRPARASWVWLALSAVAMAFSVTSKVSSAVMLPAIALLIVLAPDARGRRSGRRWARSVAGLVLFGAVFAAVVLLVYLPVGFGTAVGYMLEYQSVHDAQGHLVTVAGAAYVYPPWWANLWYSLDGMGVPATVVLVSFGVAALFSRRWALLAVLGTALAGLLVFYLAVSNVALNHYYYAWVWLLCAAAGIGVSTLLRAGPTRGRRILGRVTAVALLAVALAAAVYTSVQIAAVRPSGMQLVLPELERLGIDGGDILVAGMAEWEYTYVLDERETVDPTDPDIVAYATKDEVRFPLDPTWLAAFEARGPVRTIVIDDVTLRVREPAGTGSTAPTP